MPITNDNATLQQPTRKNARPGSGLSLSVLGMYAPLRVDRVGEHRSTVAFHNSTVFSLYFASRPRASVNTSDWTEKKAKHENGWEKNWISASYRAENQIVLKSADMPTDGTMCFQFQFAECRNRRKRNTFARISALCYISTLASFRPFSRCFYILKWNEKWRRRKRTFLGPSSAHVDSASHNHSRNTRLIQNSSHGRESSNCVDSLYAHFDLFPFFVFRFHTTHSHTHTLSRTDTLDDRDGCIYIYYKLYAQVWTQFYT